MRGSIPASYAVLPSSHSAHQRLEGGTLASADHSYLVVVQFLKPHGLDLSRGHAARSTSLQPLRELRRDAAGERNAVRRVRPETEQARATLLNAGVAP